MKEYTVYFIIKKNNHGYMNQQTVTAKNQKKAIVTVREKVKEDTGRHAFHCSCKAPKRMEHGLYYKGMVYTRYSELFNQLW